MISMGLVSMARSEEILKMFALMRFIVSLNRGTKG